MQTALTRTGHYRGEAHGEIDDATRAALADFAGQVNLEAKVREDGQHLPLAGPRGAGGVERRRG